MNGKVTVYGHDITQRPLCDTTDATMVVVRDESGAPIVLLVRLAGDTWGLTTPEDKDWNALCVRFGIAEPRPAAVILAESH